MPSKIGATTASVAGGAAGTATAAVGAAAAEVTGDAAWHAQIAALTAETTKATERDVQLRIVSTELTTIKKVADERVQ
ncbi:MULTISPECIES: hypothetical protein [Bradyrhizobium]|uniref:Nodulation protein NopA n=3 Tax=Bradyrhizobium TaxID=374 RepID=A0AAE6CC80_9BRAD|nr:MULTISPECIES: hypothetical protein [Bradyrhizobium]MCG2632876.1 hypothetical protein [Bradyrhizobium zhengyangense]MCG2645489.1 hypothetical protein [Bradyrhizobium zhengyangense]MCG2673048.1 hypothetical protein [Bradyrhizobium zhengyangense]MDN4984425.1 hypothetical protein [Bradyrhizobium sp. WYCCWR 13022]MDN5002418.1 hypothetical protein [Bradyrhizobium sp. WYCCWR 12677]